MELESKNVYVDEIQTNYIFYAFKALNQFNQDKQLNIFHYDDNLSLIYHQKDKYMNQLLLDFNEIIEKEEIDTLVLIRSSRLSKAINNNAIPDFGSRWVFIKKSGEFAIYSKIKQ